MKKKIVTTLAALLLAAGTFAFTGCMSWSQYTYPDHNMDHYYHHTAHSPSGNYYHYEHQDLSPTGRGHWRMGEPFPVAYNKSQ